MNFKNLFYLKDKSPSALQTKLYFYSVINNLSNIRTPLHALQAINHNHLNNFERRRLFKASTKLRPINSHCIQLSTKLYNNLENPNRKDLNDLITQRSFGCVDHPVDLFDNSSPSNLIELLKLAEKLPNKTLYNQVYAKLQHLGLEFDYNVVVIHLFHSSNKFGYLNRLFKHINYAHYDDGQLRHILFKLISLLLDGQLSSHGNNLYDAIALLDEWNRAFFGLLGVTKNTTHPIFSLSNYNGLPQLNRPLAPAYLVIMQRAAQLGYLSLCFEMLHHLVDQNALIDKLASEESERSRMRARLSTFQPLAVPLNTYITLYQACKTTTDQTIDQRRHLLQQLHTYFIAQPSFAVIKGRDTVLLHTKSAAAPSPNQVLLILSTFLTVTEDIGKVLRVWQELRVKFRKCSGWNRVERFSAIRKVIFDCRDELQKESKKSKDGIDSKDSKDNAWSDIDHEQAIQRRKHPEIPKTHPQHITPNQPI